MAVLPLFKGFTESVLQMLQSQWSAPLNKLLATTIVQGLQINGIELTASTPKSIPHTLCRTMQGYFISSQSANAVIWMTGSFNASTLTLESSANVTVSLWVY